MNILRLEIVSLHGGALIGYHTRALYPIQPWETDAHQVRSFTKTTAVSSVVVGDTS